MSTEDPTKDYLAKISALQTNVGTLQAQLRQTVDQIERLNRLQSAIVGMYLEFKDRSHEDATMHRSPEEEKAELLAESPLVILDRLRASLRVLLAFKEDFENELKAAISRQLSEKDATAKDLSARLAAAQEKIRDLTNQLNTVKKYQEDSIDREKNIKKKADERNLQMEVELSQLRAKIDEKNTQIQGMKDLVAERDDLLRNRDTRLSRISQLESQLQLNRLQSQFDLSKVQTASRLKILQLEKESLKFSRLEAENAELRERVRVMTTQLASYQANMQVKKTNALEQELSRCKNELEGYKNKLAVKEEQLRTAEANFTQSKLQVANLHQRISALAGDTAISQPAQGKVTPKGSMSSPMRGSMSARAAKHSTSHSGVNHMQSPAGELSAAEISQQHIFSSYKDRLKEKDLEIEELAKRVRRLLTLQHRSALSQRAWEEERTKLEKQISGLRDDVTQLRKLLGNKAMGQVNLSEDRSDVKDDTARDIQNLRAFAITTSHAFNQLQANEKSSAATGSFKRLAIQQLDPVIDPRTSRLNSGRPMSSSGGNKGSLGEYASPSPNRNRPVSAAQSNKIGRGAGYGRGSMLGRTANMKTPYNFGLN